MVIKVANILFSFILLVYSTSLLADDDETSPNQQGWQYKISTYIWGQTIGGEDAAGDDIDIGFDDLRDNLNFAIMGMLTARNGNWLVFGDIQYADLEGDDRTTADLVGNPVKVDLDFEIIQWLAHAGGGYTISRNDKHIFDIVTGVRYLHQDTTFKFKIGATTIKVDDKADNIDAILGVNNHLKLNDRWYLNSYLDAGTGESKFTWQGMALIGYQFNSVDALFGYRHIYWDFDGNKGLGESYNELDFSGPILGATFKF